MLCSTPRVKRSWVKKRRTAKRSESGKESLFKGGVWHFFLSPLSSCSGFLWCALFFSFNIIIPPRWKTIARIHITHSTATYTQFFPHRRFCWCFSLFYNFCCFYFHSAAVQPAFDSVFSFCSYTFCFFFGAKSFTNFYSLFIRVRTTTAKSCSRAVACRCLSLTDFCARLGRKIFRIEE